MGKISNVRCGAMYTDEWFEGVRHGLKDALSGNILSRYDVDYYQSYLKVYHKILAESGRPVEKICSKDNGSSLFELIVISAFSALVEKDVSEVSEDISRIRTIMNRYVSLPVDSKHAFEY